MKSSKQTNRTETEIKGGDIVVVGLVVYTAVTHTRSQWSVIVDGVDGGHMEN